MNMYTIYYLKMTQLHLPIGKESRWGYTNRARAGVMQKFSQM